MKINSFTLVLLQFLLFMSLLGPVSAAEVEPRGGVIIGCGAHSCGKYLHEKETFQVQYVQWTIGFLSGLNYSTDSQMGVKTDIYAVMKHIDNYCEKNPLHSFWQAVLDLAISLAEKEQKQLAK